jgi:hypothetical protein
MMRKSTNGVHIVTGKEPCAVFDAQALARENRIVNASQPQAGKMVGSEHEFLRCLATLHPFSASGGMRYAGS